MTKALLAIGLGVSLLLIGAGPGAAVIDDPDVDTFATYEYRVSPEDGIVDVTINLAVTADKANRAAGGGSYYEYYFQGYFLVIPLEALNVTVTDPAGRELDYIVDETVDDVQVLEIDFRRSIFYRQTADIVVSYTMPAGDARSEALTRVNDAYAGFEIWLTPQIEKADVTVITPFGFDDRSTGSQPFIRQLKDGEKLFVAEDVDPETYWALVSLARDDSLVTTEVEVDDHTVEISSWPGDEVWTEHVITNLEEGLPHLIEQVGLPWPIRGELAIIESYSPYLSGYAGWYDPNTDEIEIGDELDSHLVFHELSHVWFNEDLFDQRWITEGLAEVYGAAVIESLGEKVPTPDPTSMLDSSAQPLNRWTTFTSESEVETWSYGASWTVTEAIVDEVGLDVLSAAIQFAANDQIAYVGDGEPELGRKQQDWRLYLDLIENHGEVADDAVTDLFEEWVLLGTQQPVIEQRAASRSAYAVLNESGGEWAPPLVVRQAMSEWKFSDADELIDEAQTIVERRDEVLDILEPVAASLPTELERGYESDAELSATAELLSDVRSAAEQLSETDGRIKSVSGPLQWVGAIGSDHDADFAGAVSAFEQNRLAGAIEQSEAIDSDIDQLTKQGLIRGAIVLLGLLVVVIAVFWTLRSRRKARQAESGGSTPPPSESSVPVQNDWAPPEPVETVEANVEPPERPEPPNEPGLPADSGRIST